MFPSQHNDLIKCPRPRVLAWQGHLQPWKHCYHHSVPHPPITHTLLLPSWILGWGIIAPLTTRTDPATHWPGLLGSPMPSVGVSSSHPSRWEFLPSQCWRFLHRTSQEEIIRLFVPQKGELTLPRFSATSFLPAPKPARCFSLSQTSPGMPFSLCLWFLLS